MRPNDLNEFKRLFEKASYAQSYDITFRDFLTVTLCTFSRNLATGLSYQEELYLQTIEPYRQRETLKYFPQAVPSSMLLPL